MVVVGMPKVSAQGAAADHRTQRREALVQVFEGRVEGQVGDHREEAGDQPELLFDDVERPVGGYVAQRGCPTRRRRGRCGDGDHDAGNNHRDEDPGGHAADPEEQAPRRVRSCDCRTL